MAKDYYVILGVNRDATRAEIKDAYRRRAKELHPDNYGPDVRPFIDVQEAYTVLSHPENRIAYDRRAREVRSGGGYRLEPRAGSRAPVERLRGRMEPVHVGDVSLVRSFRTFRPSFDEIFDRLWSNFSSLGRPKSETVRGLSLEIALTPEQARRGGTARILVPARRACPTCGGRGRVGVYPCGCCSGEGAISGEYPVMVRFPPLRSGRREIEIPLDSFGIRNLFLRVLFRVTGIEVL